MLNLLSKNLNSWVVKLLLIVLIACFGVLFGVSDFFRPGHQNEVATVGKRKIKAYELAQELQHAAHVLSQKLGQPVDIQQLHRMGQTLPILNQLIHRALLEQEADRLGLVVSDHQIREIIREVPLFKDSHGSFSKERFQHFLKARGIAESTYIQKLRNDIAVSTLLDSAADLPFVPQTITRTVFLHETEKRQVHTLLIPVNSFQAPSASEEDYRKFYDSHKAYFLEPERRDISVLIIDPQQIAAPIKILEEDLKQEYNRRLSDFAEPETREVYRIEAHDRKTLTQLANHITLEKSLSKAIKKLNNNKVTSDNLGRLTKEIIEVPSLAAAIFSAPQGKLIIPSLENEQGKVQAFYVSKIHPERQKTLKEAKSLIEAELKSHRALEKIYQLSRQVEDDLAAGSSFKEIAQQHNIEHRMIEKIDQYGMNEKGQEVIDPTIAAKAFQLAENEESSVTEMASKGYFIVKPIQTHLAYTKDYENVKAIIKKIWASQQADRMAREKAKLIVQALDKGGNIATLAAQHHYTHKLLPPLTRTEHSQQTSETNQKSLSRGCLFKIFTTPQHKATYCKIGDTYHIMQVKNIIISTIPNNKTTYTNIEKLLLDALIHDTAMSFVESLKHRYPVKIHSDVLNKIL